MSRKAPIANRLAAVMSPRSKVQRLCSQGYDALRVCLALLLLFLVNSANSADSAFRDTAVIPAFREASPQLAHFKTIFRTPAYQQHDLLLVLGGAAALHDSWPTKGDVLGVFLQDRKQPNRVYKLALRTQARTGFHIDVARYRPGELTLAERPAYGTGAFNVKLFFDVRSKQMTRQAEYQPLTVSFVMYKEGVPYFIAENGNNKQPVVARPGDNGFEVLTGPALNRFLAQVPASEWVAAQGRSQDVNQNGAVRFGSQSRFSLHIEKNQSWGRVATAIEERTADKTRTYALEQSSCAEFKKRRPKQFSLNRCPLEVLEEIGPHQVFEDQLWFAKSFYDAEGSGGVGAFGYFDPLERKYHLFSPPEIADWSGSALLVEKDAVWIALMHRGEYGNTTGGLLRWDRGTQTAVRYNIRSLVSHIVRYQDRLYLAAGDGIEVLRGAGAPETFMFDQTSTGAYSVLAR